MKRDESNLYFMIKSWFQITQDLKTFNLLFVTARHQTILEGMKNSFEAN